MYNNRAFKYGDCLFETIKIIEGKIILSKYHFYRLKKSMEFLEFTLPEKFSFIFFEDLIHKNIPNKKSNYRLRLNIFRDSEGLYIPNYNNAIFYLDYSELGLENISYLLDKDNYTIDIYDKLKVQISPISNLKTNNRIINVMAGLELQKNPILHNILLLNDHKNVVESFNSNIFCIKNNEIFTPKLDDGCINGVFRNFLIDNHKVNQISININFLSSCDEIFLTNSISGITIVDTFISKKMETKKTRELSTFLNDILIKKY